MLGLATKQRRTFYGRFAAFMPLVVSAVLLTAAFAFPQVSYAAAVGNTFSSDGFKYEVVEEGKVQLIGWEKDPIVDPATNALYELRTTIWVKEDASYVDYEVVGIAQGALEGFDQTLVLDATSDSLFSDALSSESGIGSDAVLTLKTDTYEASSINLKSSSSYELTEDGSAARTVTLPEGYSFNSYVISGVDTTFTNSTSSAVDVVYEGSSKDVTYSVPVGESLKTKWFRPCIDTLTYSVNGGNEESYSVGYEPKIEITLPEGTPLDATIKVDLSLTPGIAKGFVTSNWDNNQTEVTLENGTASVEVDLISESYISQSFTSTITFKVAESETMPSVWIAGVRYNAPFEKDGMALSYDEQGTPTLTLDGASIDIFSSTSDNCAIHCQGDLNIVLENSDSSITVGDSQQAIKVEGELSISTAGMSSGSDATLKVIYGNASSKDNWITSLIHANSIEIIGFMDVTCVDEGRGTGDSVTVFDSENDIVVGFRSEVSVGVNNKYRSAAPVPAATYYGFVSHKGSIELADASVTLDGYLTSSLVAWGKDNTSGTISIDGRSTLYINNQNTAQFGAVFNPCGTVEIDVLAQGSVDIEASRPDDADPNLLSPAAIIAKDIAISSLNILGEPEGGTIEAINDLSAFGELKTIMSSDDKTVPSNSVLIVSDYLNEMFAGKTISSVFSDSFGQFIWTDVLNKTESYNPSYTFTARDGFILATCTSLDCVDIPAADFASSGIENLPALRSLTIELPDTETATLALPDSLYLDELNIYSFLPQSLVIESAYTEKLAIYAIEGDSSNTSSIELKQGVECSYVSIEGFDNLKTVLLPNQFGLDTLGALNVLCELDVLSCSALESLTLPDGFNADAVVVNDCAALSSINLGSGSPLQSLRVNYTQVTEIVLPDGMELQALDVSNNKIKNLVIPDSSKSTLESLVVYGNALPALDLSGFSNLRNCVLADPDDESRSQQVEFVGVEQKDGSVVVDVSSVAASLTGFESGKGSYDSDNQTVVFASAEDAEQGFSYKYDTAAQLNNVRSTSSLMPVQVSIAVQPYSDSSQGGDSSQSGNGDQTTPPATGQGNGDDGSKADADKGKDGSSTSPETSDNLAPYVLIIGGIALVAVIGIVVSLIVRARSKR